MKITVIGGGAHRVLGIMRAIMAVPKVMSDGEISLYDLNPVRAEAMGRMLLRTPEQSERRVPNNLGCDFGGIVGRRRYCT